MLGAMQLAPAAATASRVRSLAALTWGKGRKNPERGAPPLTRAAEMPPAAAGAASFFSSLAGAGAAGAGAAASTGAGAAGSSSTAGAGAASGAFSSALFSSTGAVRCEAAQRASAGSVQWQAGPFFPLGEFWYGGSVLFVAAPHGVHRLAELPAPLLRQASLSWYGGRIPSLLRPPLSLSSLAPLCTLAAALGLQGGPSGEQPTRTEELKGEGREY